MENQYSYTKEKTKNDEIKLLVKVLPAKFMDVKDKVYHKLAADVVITGFRPGKAPRNLIEARISHELYDETINKIIPEVTSEIIATEKLNPLNQLHYDIVKMSDAEGLEYNATFVNAPEIKLMDFTKIKVKLDQSIVTENDIEQEIEKLVKMYGPKTSKTSETPKDKDEEKTILTDEVVKGMNLGFDSLTKLKDQVKIELEASKKYEAEQKLLNEILEQAIKGSKIVAPKAMIEADLHHREHEYTDQIEKLGLKVEDFLKSQNTTLAELKEKWQTESIRQINQELLLYEVIKQNSITVTKDEVEKELNAIQDEDRKQQLQTESGIRYISTIILQQKAINFIKSKVKQD